jgi:undecaprenyl-diphosphatase
MIELLEGYDRNLLLGINSHHNQWMDVVMFYISGIWICLPLFIYWFSLFLKKYELKKVMILVFFLVALVTLTDQTSNRVKHSVIEIKDQIHVVNDYHGGQYGFFSGHAANAFGIAMLLFLLFKEHSILVRSSFFAWAGITAYSRLYLGVHYPSDILVGIVVGLIWGYVIYQLIQFTFKKYFNEVISV